MFRSEPIFAEAIKKELHLLLGNTFSNSNTTIANFFSQSSYEQLLRFMLFSNVTPPCTRGSSGSLESE